MWPHNVQKDTMSWEQGGEQWNDEAEFLSILFETQDGSFPAFYCRFGLFKELALITGTACPLQQFICTTLKTCILLNCQTLIVHRGLVNFFIPDQAKEWTSFMNSESSRG